MPLGPMRLPAEQIVLTVDLDSGSIGTEQIGDRALRKFIGGRGVAGNLLYERMAAGVDPLGPANLLIFSAGALTGTLAPAAARTTMFPRVLQQIGTLSATREGTGEPS